MGYLIKERFKIKTGLGFLIKEKFIINKIYIYNCLSSL